MTSLIDMTNQTAADTARLVQLAREHVYSVLNVESAWDAGEINLTVDFAADAGDDSIIQVLYRSYYDDGEVVVEAKRITGRMPVDARAIVPCDEALHDVTRDMLSGDARVLDWARREWRYLAGR